MTADTPPSATPDIIVMPKAVRHVRNFIACILVCITAWLAYRAYLSAEWFGFVLTLFYLAAAIGLLRGVSWGRHLTSWAFLMLVFMVASILISPGDSDYPANSLLALMLGFWPPVWLDVLFIVLVSLVILLPLVVIGWRRDYFRRQLW